MMLVVAFMMAQNEVVKPVSDIEIAIVVLVQFLFMVDRRSFLDQLATEKAKPLIPVDYFRSNLLPQFGLVDRFVLLRYSIPVRIQGLPPLCPCCE